MLLSDVDIKDATYELILNGELSNLINGSVYKDARPMNSDKEDISISVLAGDASEIQEFILNVNVFVPDIHRGNENVENTERLRLLARECLKVFQSDVKNDRVWFVLDSQRIMAVEDAGFHFINNRVLAKCYTGSI